MLGGEGLGNRFGGGDVDGQNKARRNRQLPRHHNVKSFFRATLLVLSGPDVVEPLRPIPCCGLRVWTVGRYHGRRWVSYIATTGLSSSLTARTRAATTATPKYCLYLLMGTATPNLASSESCFSSLRNC